MADDAKITAELAESAIAQQTKIDALKKKREQQLVAQNQKLPSVSKPVDIAVDPRPPQNDRCSAKSAAMTRPDRAGKVLVSGYFSPATHKALKHLAIDENKSLQQVMADAFELLLASKRR